jgi:tRNA pseudouridine38-40 synthase
VIAVQRLRIDLAYDGEPYSGFARQPGRVTVQGAVEDALARLVGRPVSTTGAGRTDRGVHALGQVVHADVEADARSAPLLADPDVLRARLGHLLAPTITVWAVRRVPATFDARFSAMARHYRYRLVDADTPDPLRRHDRWCVGAALDVASMRRAARVLLGEHDFAAFCRRAPGRTTVRRLDVVALSRPSPARIDVRLVGPAFCHQQVRGIVGCLVEVGRGRRPVDWLAEVLVGRDRSAAAPLAPPHGLTLERVAYGRRWPAAPPADAVRALGLAVDRSG